MVLAFTAVSIVMLKAGDAIWQASKERQRYAMSADAIATSYKGCEVVPADAAQEKTCRETVQAEVARSTAVARKKASAAFTDRLFSWSL